MKTLDVTSFKETGLDLVTAIEIAFEDTQRLLIQPYPSVLKLTKPQFDDLMRLSSTPIESMYGSEKDRLYRTKGGYVMEVEVSS